jgi:formate dehydrogenase iron-sulfur subunit
MKNAILIDTTKCTGCERCVSACIDANQLDAHQAEIDRSLTKDGLSSDRWASIQEVSSQRFARKSCMHCLEPSCVSACLVGGISKTPQGPVVYDPAKCIGCRYCMLACPFHVPRYEWEKTMPYMRKCDMCFERTQKGGKPACVEACPNEALIFGSRTELLRKAHETIGANASRYIPHVWGEEEFGGTSVLYISDEDLSALGWPETHAAAIPSLTEPLISKTPFIGLGVAAGLLTVNWIVRRRMKLAVEPENREVDRND